MSDELFDPTGRHAELEGGFLAKPEPEQAEPETVSIDAAGLAELAGIGDKLEEHRKAKAIDATFELADEAAWESNPLAVAARLTETHGSDFALEWANQYGDLGAIRLVADVKLREAEEAQAARAEQEAETSKLIAEQAQGFLAQVPAGLRDTVVQLAQRSGVTAETPEHARDLLAASLRSARELELAKQKAAILAEFDEAEHIERGASGDWSPEDSVHTFNREASILSNTEKQIDPARLSPRPSAEDYKRQIESDLFDEETCRQSGWNIK